ncbi:hypothetical protein [Rhodococcus sp. A14]|uniref:hypothetical protein n=1 Tax=Rhodococcus sp. A14 TaxID=1194106 RepID=UPI00141F556C|nr:hypothetical protein [Rhodococcus sp. A14]
MHDIDRVLFEDSGEVYGETGQFETDGQREELGSYGQQEETGSYGQQEETGTYGEGLYEESVTEETTNESTLATELLEITSDEELDRFLGNLVSSAVSAAKNFANSDAGRAVGSVLKTAAKQVLPQIGQAVGDYIAPGSGGAWGQSAGKWLGSKLELGLDVEGLSPEDRQFETARAFVRFAGNTARTAAQAPRSIPPKVAANRAALVAAQRHLPGLISMAGTRRRRRQSGRWVRRGRNIIIIDA